MVESLFGMLICMLGASMGYSSYMNIETAKLFANLSYSETNVPKLFRPLSKSRAVVFKSRLPTVEEMAQKKQHLRRYINL
jgi:hypothetical protein